MPIKQYKPKLSYALQILTIPVILAFGLVLLGATPDLDFAIAMLFFVLGASVPLIVLVANKVEVNDESRKVVVFFFGFKTLELSSHTVSRIYDGHLLPVLPGGGGFGKGIIIETRYKGKRRLFRMGIGLYGKAAVEHVRSVLKP